MTKKRKKLHGSVKKVIKSVVPSEPEKAEIEIEEADELYKEIRIANEVSDENGSRERLKQGEDVDLILESESATDQKKQ